MNEIECYECGQPLDPDGDIYSITGCIKDYCIACSNGIDHENFPPHTNISPSECDHKSSILTAENLWLCTWGCGMTWEKQFGEAGQS